MIDRFIYIFLLLISLHSVHASEQQYSVEVLKQDLKHLYEGLQSAHYDLYVNTPKAEFDAAYQETLQQLNGPMSKSQVEVLFQKLAARSHIAHTRIDLPSQAFAAFRESGGLSFPIYIKIKQGKVYITENYSGIDDITVGDELLKLNGEPIDAVLNRLRLYLSADTEVMGNGFLEFSLPHLMWLEFGALDSYKLSVKTKSRVRQFTVPGKTREDITKIAETQPKGLQLGWERQAKMLPNKLAYLRPGPFFNFEGEADQVWDRASFVTFIDQAFSDFLEADAQAQALLIDLRDNPGGDNSFSDVMISWFADEPFRFASRFSIKVSKETTESNRVRLDQKKNAEDTSDISSQYAKAFAARKPGDVFDFDIPRAEPRQGKRFEKPVFALINRHSYSNTVFVAAILQDYGLATILGEETRDLATSYGAMEHFTLPSTGIRVGYPKAFIVRPSGDQTIRGVVPDVLIETPIIENQKDAVLQQAIEALHQRLTLEKKDQVSVRQKVVRDMIAAVNQRNAKAYASHFTNNVRVVVEGEVKVAGRKQLLENRTQHFKNHPQVKAEIQHLVEIDDQVIMHDQVWLYEDVENPADIVEIMTFENNKISEMQVIQPKNLFNKQTVSH